MNILAVDDHPLFLESLVTLIKDQIPGAKISTALDGNQAIDMLEQVNPALMILDVSMPGMNGLRVAECVSKKYPQVKIIMLTNVNGKAMVLSLVAVVHGFLFKDVRLAVFKECIDTVLNGEKFYCEKSEKMIFKNIYGFGELPSVRLTKRELSIVKSLAKGKTSKEISKESGLSEKTIKGYREDLLRKTKTRNSSELVMFAIHNNLISQDDLSED